MSEVDFSGLHRAADDIMAALDHARAERDRLRAALELIVAEYEDGYHEHGSETHSLARIISYARAALKPPKEDR